MLSIFIDAGCAVAFKETFGLSFRQFKVIFIGDREEVQDTFKFGHGGLVGT